MTSKKKENIIESEKENLDYNGNIKSPTNISPLSKMKLTEEAPKCENDESNLHQKNDIRNEDGYSRKKSKHLDRISKARKRQKEKEEKEEKERQLIEREKKKIILEKAQELEKVLINNNNHGQQSQHMNKIY